MTFAAARPPLPGPGWDSGLAGESRRLPEEVGSPGSRARRSEHVSILIRPGARQTMRMGIAVCERMTGARIKEPHGGDVTRARTASVLCRPLRARVLLNKKEARPPDHRLCAAWLV